MKTVHLLRNYNTYFFSPRFKTVCGIMIHRVVGSWELKDVTCKNCIKTKIVRNKIVERLTK